MTRVNSSFLFCSLLVLPLGCGSEEPDQAASAASSSSTVTASASGAGGGGGASANGAGGTVSTTGAGGAPSGNQAACQSCATMQFSSPMACLTKLNTCKQDSTCTAWADCLLACTTSNYTAECYAGCGSPPDMAGGELKACMCGACAAECGLACTD